MRGCYAVHRDFYACMQVRKNWIAYGILPRDLVLIAIAAIFTMLCERTAGMLSNLLDAEAQEKMMRHMQEMQEKSRQTSDELLQMVKELSMITESSMKANGQIAEETSSVLMSFSENTEEMTGINERTQDINKRLIALVAMNEQVAEQIQKLSEQTKEAVSDIGKIVTEVVSHTENAVAVMEQSVKLTKGGMESSREAGNSTAVITSSNSQMSDQITQMDKTVGNIQKQSSEVARGMAQVHSNTQNNCSAIEHVTAATQENSAGVEEIESMVERIKALAYMAVEESASPAGGRGRGKNPRNELTTPLDL